VAAGLAGALASPVALEAQPKPKITADERRKLEHAENLKDIERMEKLVREIQAVLEEKKQHVLSIKNLDRLEEIEELSRKVRGRLRR
jgi:UDP-N-acetylglucosamine enolpyruvyl transferase